MKNNKHIITLYRLSHRSHISGKRIYKSKLGRRYFDILAYRLKELEKSICERRPAWEK